MDFLIELFYKGGWVMWPILFQGILSISIFIEKLLFLIYTKLPQNQLEEIIEKILNDFKIPFDLLNNPIQIRNENIKILQFYYQQNNNKKNSSLQTMIDLEVKRLSRRLDLLLLNGQLAPLLGLLGTVLGMIETFQKISQIDSPLTPSLIASGIWVAMLTTAFGLIVAIPSYIFYAILEKQVRNRIDTMNQILSILEEKNKSSLSTQKYES